jgi:hypothetical protein
MTTTLNSDTRGIDFLSGRVKNSVVLTFDFNSTSAIVIEKVWPANSLVTTVTVFVDTAFNATTTNTFSLGITGSNTYYINATSITNTGVLVGVIASTAQTTGATSLTYTYGQTGAAATTGKAYVVIDYVVGKAGFGTAGGLDDL